MRNARPTLIGSTELWSARLYLSEPQEIADLQHVVTEHVTQSGITIVGYYTNHPPALTLLRWPETREGYRSPTIPECNLALSGLALRLQAQSTQHNAIPKHRLHTMMGRKKDGYNGGRIAALSDLESSDLDNCTVIGGHMISARTIEGNDVESYEESVWIILTDAAHEAQIHQLAEGLEQWHYAIEDGVRGVTDFYETHWATT